MGRDSTDADIRVVVVPAVSRLRFDGRSEEPYRCVAEDAHPTMSPNRNGAYVGSSTDVVERSCDHCGWHAVEDAYPALIERYQDHLRDAHPTVWLRR